MTATSSEGAVIARGDLPAVRVGGRAVATAGEAGQGTAGRWPIPCRACGTVLAWRLADGRLVPATAAVVSDDRTLLACGCGREVWVESRAWGRGHGNQSY